MAFNINNWSRWSVSYNSFPPDAWAYTGTKNGESDSLDDIKASGFFDKAANFLKISHLIYAEGVAGPSIFPSRQLLVVTGIDPVTVEPLQGLTPIAVAVHVLEFEPLATGFVQNFIINGVLPTDIPQANVKANPQSVDLLAVEAKTDLVTTTFRNNPGTEMLIQILFFRETFS